MGTFQCFCYNMICYERIVFCKYCKHLFCIRMPQRKEETKAVVFKFPKENTLRVIILNRGSTFAFNWREFSPPLSSAHRLLPCFKRQTEIGDDAIPREFPLSLPPLGSLANERAVPCAVTLWRCTFWSGKFVSLSSRSLERHAPSI